MALLPAGGTRAQNLIVLQENKVQSLVHLSFVAYENFAHQFEEENEGPGYKHAGGSLVESKGRSVSWNQKGLEMGTGKSSGSFLSSHSASLCVSTALFSL